MQTEPVLTRSGYAFSKEEALAIQQAMKAYGYPSKIVQFTREEIENLKQCQL